MIAKHIDLDKAPAARMRRSRASLAARGGRLVQMKFEGDASRALSALELTTPRSSRTEIAAHALIALAARKRFPLRLTREEEIRLAALARGPFTVRSFRATDYADEFLAGLALAFATDRRLPRDRLLALARTLAPDLVTAEGYRRWLDASPIRLVRLFKLVDAELDRRRTKRAA